MQSHDTGFRRKHGGSWVASMKAALPLLLAASLSAHAAPPDTGCNINGWVKVQPPPAAARGTYSDPAWPATVPLYADSFGGEVAHILPDAFSGTSYDYLAVTVEGYLKSVYLPVRITAYGAEQPQTVRGFLHRQHLGFTLQSSTLYESADSSGTPRLVLENGRTLSASGEIIFHNCQNEFVRIDYRQTVRTDRQGRPEPIPEDERQTLTNVWARGVCGTLGAACGIPGRLPKTERRR